MHTIKGPIHIKRGEKIPDVFFKGVKMRLPFTAENFRSTKNFELVKGGKKLVPGIQAKEREPSNPGETVTVKAHEKDVIPGEGIEIKKIKSYKRRKRKGVSRK